LLERKNPGDHYFEGRKFKSYRGMGSVEGWKQVLDRYFQDVEDDVRN
jgi:IMP dehydrogenase/GMP reductase